MNVAHKIMPRVNASPITAREHTTMDIFNYRFDYEAFYAYLKSEEGSRHLLESLESNALYQKIKSQAEPICPVAGNE